MPSSPQQQEELSNVAHQKDQTFCATCGQSLEAYSEGMLDKQTLQVLDSVARLFPALRRSSKHLRATCTQEDTAGMNLNQACWTQDLSGGLARKVSALTTESISQ